MAWQSVFDNTVWESGTSGSGQYETWTGSMWLIMANGDYGYNRLASIGGWQDGFRPTRFRITLGGEYYAKVWVGTSTDVSLGGWDYGVTPLDEDGAYTLTFTGDDIGQITIYPDETGVEYELTNIEFDVEASETCVWTDKIGTLEVCD